MFKKVVVAGLLAVCGVANAANPIIKGVFVDSTTGAYLKGPVYVSKSGDDSNGGTSWADAKLTIQAGITAAIAIGDGTTVLVGPGTYSDSTTCSDGASTPTVVNMITKKIYLKSSEGKEKTIILGQYGSGSTDCGNGARRCIYSAVAGNVVDGFTLKNGATVTTASGNNSHCCGGGITSSDDGGESWAKAYGWGSATQVWIVNSDVLDCRAARGAAFGRGVVAINCYVAGCKAVDGNIVNYRSYSCYNCIFEGNGAGSSSHMLFSQANCGSALNCTFIGNFCDSSKGINASERHFFYNCALINNQYEVGTDATKIVASNCVTTSSSSIFSKEAHNSVGGGEQVSGLFAG